MTKWIITAGVIIVVLIVAVWLITRRQSKAESAAPKPKPSDHQPDHSDYAEHADHQHEAQKPPVLQDVKKTSAAATGDYEKLADKDVEHIFNDEFRQELRNRGRLHFEKIIGENAMFLQQDLRLTTSQLNEYMKTEITKKLQEEFVKYEQSITDAKQLAIDSIQKTNDAVEEQRKTLSTQVQKEFTEQKQRMIAQFQTGMADIVNHYVLAAIGDQIDLSDQLEFILNDLETNKQAMIEDITNGS